MIEGLFILGKDFRPNRPTEVITLPVSSTYLTPWLSSGIPSQFFQTGVAGGVHSNFWTLPRRFLAVILAPWAANNSKDVLPADILRLPA